MTKIGGSGGRGVRWAARILLEIDSSAVTGRPLPIEGAAF